MSLEKAPQSFVDALAREFPDLRIRWSQKNERFCIEQQVGRAAFVPEFDDPFDDNYIRARDGYWLVLEVAPGTQAKCPDCGFWLKLPIGKAKEVRCDYCTSRGEEGVHWIYHFPIGEVLLDHLRKTDPRRGMTKAIKERADRINKALIQDRIRQRDNVVEEQMKGHFRELFEIPTVGLSGATKAWKDAPESKVANGHS